MDLTPHVEQIRGQLAIAAEAGGETPRALAEPLTAPLESATRLMLLDALSGAADEITRDLAPGSVELRLRGGEPEFVVVAPPADEAAGGGARSSSSSRRRPTSPRRTRRLRPPPRRPRATRARPRGSACGSSS